MKKKYTIGGVLVAFAVAIVVLFIFCKSSCCPFTACGKSKATEKDVNIHGVQAILYMQRSAEMEAICRQTYRWAEIVLLEKMRQREGQNGKPPAVVVDIDETVLDNSPYNGSAAKSGILFPKNWAEWVLAEEAKPIPGALEFLTKAQAMGADVFYISNRKDERIDATIANLKKEGFPNVSKKTVILQTDEANKEKRRNIVKNTHEIILMLGDNLGDFVSDFDLEGDERKDTVAKFQDKWGTDFIVLPNPAYGDWLKALPKPASKAKPHMRTEPYRDAINEFIPQTDK